MSSKIIAMGLCCAILVGCGESGSSYLLSKQRLISASTKALLSVRMP